MKVRIDPRDQCLGDDICVNLCPAVFVRYSDGKAAIVEAYRVAGNIAEGEVPDAQSDCVNTAAQSCPVGIIIVE
ncbi:MAG: ferredoxin [Fervidicoccaceae archaeon]